MALQAGNRTYYNPTHGIEWRGNLLPFNTFYAIMCLFLFFFFAMIIKFCYSYYRFEIRRAGLKQEEAKKRYEKMLAAQINRVGNGVPPGILKNSTSSDIGIGEIKSDESKNTGDGDSKSELRVQFSEQIQMGSDANMRIMNSSYNNALCQNNGSYCCHL